jgi:hypothetical protein
MSHPEPEIVQEDAGSAERIAGSFRSRWRRSPSLGLPLGLGLYVVLKNAKGYALFELGTPQG